MHILLLQLQVYRGFFFAVERTQSFCAARFTAGICLELVVDVRAQSMKIVIAFVLGDKGTNLQSLGVFELHDSAWNGTAVRIRHNAGDRAFAAAMPLSFFL